jgi:hypothetical protein
MAEDRYLAEEERVHSVIVETISDELENTTEVHGGGGSGGHGGGNGGRSSHGTDHGFIATQQRQQVL